MSTKLGFADLSRAGHVTRWHTVRTSREQTLAEHLFMVAMLTNKLAKDILGKEISDSDRLQLLEYALWHDTPELLLGDLPSPLKRRIEGICPDNNPIIEIERQIAPWLIKMQGKIKKNKAHATIVKCADLIDAILFISQEGIGKHAQVVHANLEAGFDEYLAAAKVAMPGFDWDKARRLLEELKNGETSQIAFEQRD